MGPREVCGRILNRRCGVLPPRNLPNYNYWNANLGGVTPPLRNMKSKFDPQKHHRRSIRLQGYDYSQAGAYYVTIVAQGRECLFGEIIDGEMYLNEYGEIVQKWWDEIPVHFPNVELGAFVIMPNHVHGIIFIITQRRGEVISPRYNPNKNFLNENVDETSNLGGGTPPLRKRTLGQIVAYFKYQSTKEINRIEIDKAITKFWQRNYYEHIIRDEKDLQNKTDYIESNPSLWDNDEDNPLNR
jgi:putative transposase